MEPYDLASQMQNNNILLRRQLIWTRIIAVFLILLMAVLLVFCGTFLYCISDIANEVASIDFSEFEAMTELAEKLDDLDVDALNEAIASLKETSDSIRTMVDGWNKLFS